MHILLLIFTLFLCQILYAAPLIDLREGITLAHINSGRHIHTLAIISDNNRQVKALNLSELSNTTGDIVSTYQRLGYDKIAHFIENHTSEQLEIYDYSNLLSPAGDGQHHIAMGLNYKAHTEEVDGGELPFIFLKTQAATREENIATGPQELLDYEVELCIRPLESVTNAKMLTTVALGVFICGDFTDRATLMRHIDLDNMQSGRGFNIAKSKPNYFPTGPYMVIPRQPEKFIPTVTLSLYRNQQLKQSSSVAQMTWPISTIASKIFETHNLQYPTHAMGVSQWLLNDRISKNTVILTGTPDGVIMRPPSLAFKVTKGISYIFSGKTSTMSARQYVIERYINDLLSQGKFLQPGDNITLTGTFLGHIMLTITHHD